MERMMQMYCDMKGFQKDSIRFKYKRIKIDPYATPKRVSNYFVNISIR